MVTNDDVDAIVNLWPEKWHGPLTESLAKEQNAKEQPIHQVNVEEHEGNDTQDNPSQGHIADDDDMDDSYQHPSEQPHTRDRAQTQSCVHPEEGESS